MKNITADSEVVVRMATLIYYHANSRTTAQNPPFSLAVVVSMTSVLNSTHRIRTEICGFPDFSRTKLLLFPDFPKAFWLSLSEQKRNKIGFKTLKCPVQCILRF